MRYAINGLLSLTCDGSPILGESQVKGLWTAAAVWIKEGPGVGRAVAEWMTDGYREIDVSHSDIARFHPHQKRREHTRLRTTESFIKTYGIVHPAEQYESDRDQRLVADARLASRSSARSSSRPPAGSGRTGTSPTPACSSEYGDAVMPREHEWDARWWSPIINAEHLRMREAAGVIDLSAFQIFDIDGPGRARHRAAHLRRAVRRRGRPGHLHAGARRERRLPLRPDRDAARRRPLPRRHRRRARHGRPQVVRRPPGRRRRDAHRPAPTTSRRSACGDRGRATSSPRSPTTTSPTRASASSPAARSPSAGVTVLASRISYVGELGWELYVADGGGRRSCGRRCSRPATAHGAVPVGIGVYGTTGRIEKGYRAFGYELDGERTDRRGRHAAAQGQGRRLRRPGGLPRAARGGAADGAVHADRRRPHVGVRA